EEIVMHRGQARAPSDGYQVNLTVDLNLQNIVENAIDAAMREYSPQKATIILMRPQTGEILAMANRPNYDLNERSEAKPEQMKNRAVIDMMEPGSTFKIVSAAAALNEEKVRHDTTLFCENGLWNVGGKPLHAGRTQQSHGPRQRRQAAPDDRGHGDDREWRQAQHAADREVDHDRGRQNDHDIFADGFAAGDFAGNSRASRKRFTRRRERS